MAIATIDLREARRLALARAGLLRPERTGLPTRAAGGGRRARRAALAVIRRFGYLQLDSVVVSGARSHALVLMSRLEGLEGALAEGLLAPGEPLFEYWGHEASWIPLELYPAFEFRRREFRVHPWWGDLLREHRRLADELRARLRERPLRAADLRGEGPSGAWWGWSRARKVMAALWSSGEVAVARRIGFQREYDLADRVIPAPLRATPLPLEESLEVLVERALAGHGWATEPTIAATWRLRGLGRGVRHALRVLEERGTALRCELAGANGRVSGWIRAVDLELAAQLQRARPRGDRGVLLSPFDPLLWDRARARMLFDFEQVLEIYKPPAERVYGYYCMPVLAGERLVARVDLKADRGSGRVEVLAAHGEPGCDAREATSHAVRRHAAAVGLRATGLEALRRL